MSIKKAAFINLIAKYSNILIGLLFSAIIARILSPKDYGIVAIVTVFITFFLLFTDMGIGSAIVQNKKLTKEDENSIFSFSFLLGGGLGLIFTLCSIPIVAFYSDSVYYTICPMLAVSLFFNTVNMVPNAKLLKDKKFVRVGVRTVVVTLVSYSITIVLALIGFKYYALVIQSILQALFTFLWNLYHSGLRITKIKKESLLKIRNFSVFQFAFDFMNYFSRNLDNLLIGRFMGQKKLGYYDKGYRMMLYPINNLTFVVSPVLHPILSDYQNDKKYIYEQYKKVVKLLSIIGVFITVVCFFSSREIILIMFGSQWEPSIECFRLLSISVWSQMVVTTAGAIFKSLGRTDLTFKSGLVHITIAVAMIVIGVCTGDIYKVSLLVSVSMLIRFFVEYFFLIKKGFGLPLFGFLKIFVPEILGGVLMVAVLIGVYFIHIDNIVLSLLAKASAAGVVYLVYLIATKQINYLLAIMPKKLINVFKREK